MSRSTRCRTIRGGPAVLLILVFILGSALGPPASGSRAATTGSGPIADRVYYRDVQEDNEDNAPRNVVVVQNQRDNRLRVDGRVQLNQLRGQEIRPLNQAEAYSSCVDCQTFAVALQLNLVGRGARSVTPENYAIAVNYQCIRCRTVARAIQYVREVDDPERVPDDMEELFERMNEKLAGLRSREGITADQAEAEIDGVIAQFQNVRLTSTVRDDRREDDHDD